MNNTQICEKFAQGHTKGKGSNIFIEGDTIYSYGRHFAMAKRHGYNSYLFTTRGYSNSTAKHLSHLRRALSGATLIFCENPDNFKPLEQIEENLKEIEQSKAKSERARKEHTKEAHLSHVSFLEAQNELLKGVC